LAKNEDLEK
jgi:chromosome segregation ATPase